jgi:putative ABC transport system permease protein
VDTFLQDFRYAVRQLARTPAFTIVAALTLAIGIGANTALFTLIDAIFLRPLPGIQPRSDLVWISPYSKQSGHGLSLSYPDFRDYRDSSGVFADAAAFARIDLSLSLGDTPVLVEAAIVDGSYFDVLGVRLALGRGFTEEESTTPNAHPVAVIGHRMWQERLGAADDVLGRTIVLNGQPFTIVGVAPEKFNGVVHEERLEVFVPMMMQLRAQPQFGNMLDRRGTWWLEAVGRLKPGVSLEQAKAAVGTVAARIAIIDSTDHRDVGATIQPVGGGLSPNSGDDVYPVAGLAAAATVLILLICCANVSNMLLARGVSRRREIAVRLSLGASRSRVIRQLLTEAALLSAIAAALGVLLALWATDVITTVVPAPLEITPNLNTISFTVAAAILTGLVFGLVPALHSTRGQLTAALKDSTIGRDARRSRLQSSFVVAQLSLSLVLLVMAGMFLSSLYRSMKRDVGFEATSHVLAAQFDLGLQGYTADQSRTFVDELQRRVEAMAGVDDVTFTASVPMGERKTSGELSFDPREVGTSPSVPATSNVYWNEVRPGFFKTLGIGIVRGRDFAMTDGPTSEPVVIVSEDFARRAWPGVDPIGKHVSTEGPKGPFLPVVGVVREAMTYGVGEDPRPTLYFPQLQARRVSSLTILVRSPGDAATLARPVAAAIRALDKNLPVVGVQTLERYRSDRLSETRMGSLILAIVGTLALVLACIGVYSVIAFSVGQRTREIGLRIALGAAGRQVTGLFVREGARLTMIGLAVGLGLSALLAKVLSAVFLGVSAIDSIAFVGVTALLAGIAGLASWIPARRAAGVDPMVALRAD